ncbi:MAG: hypothetical protein FJX31_07370 [Alphaproteobacteria bacterium]|nr:hypothetical protein [Alphaproteobacteria bacterium]
MKRSKSPRLFRHDGWVVEKRPNSFAERYSWIVTAVDSDGYFIEDHGFFSKRDALAFADANEPPRARKLTAMEG